MKINSRLRHKLILVNIMHKTQDKLLNTLHLDTEISYWATEVTVRTFSLFFPRLETLHKIFKLLNQY